MKTGYYLRYVPALCEYVYYFYSGYDLFSLSRVIFDRNLEMEILWEISMHKKPIKPLGFEFLCNEMME